MSDQGPACFGKLPFNLLDRLQVDCSISQTYWADAVSVPGNNPSLTSIDTISLDLEDLPNSVAIAILHSMNDVFAANGFPLSFSISMILPSETDIDMLSRINLAIVKCAEFAKCTIGKLHTNRATGTPTVTVCVNGEPTGLSSHAAPRGKVVLVGENLVWVKQNQFFAQATMGLTTRMQVARAVAGPKKDVSGDGLAGALIQLSRRDTVSIGLWEKSLLILGELHTGNGLQEKNYLDYAGLIQGSYCPSLRATLFAPRVFGPIVCLVDELTDVDPTISTIIGVFEAGRSNLRFITS